MEAVQIALVNGWGNISFPVGNAGITPMCQNKSLEFICQFTEYIEALQQHTQTHKIHTSLKKSKFEIFILTICSKMIHASHKQ